MRRERKEEGLEAGGEEDEICRMKKRRRIRRRMRMNTVLRSSLNLVLDPWVSRHCSKNLISLYLQFCNWLSVFLVKELRCVSSYSGI